MRIYALLLLLVCAALHAAAPQTYAVVSPGGVVINVVEWDGVSNFVVTPNTLVATGGSTAAQIGGTESGGVFTAPASAPIQGIVDLTTPATGFSHQIPVAQTNPLLMMEVIEPAATIASGTFIMPIGPSDGMQLILFSTHTITAVTFTPQPGTAVNNAPTTLTALAGVTLWYSAQFSAWFQL